MKNKPFLSVVIPAYNEEKNVKSGVLNQVFKYLSKQSYSWEVLVVDDGSKDKTQQLVKDFCLKHKNFSLFVEPHRGKAGTVTAGMLKTKGEIILFTDMDQATPINQIEKLLPKLKSGFDIAIGSRSGRKGAPLTRKLMAYGFTILRTIILRLPYKDTQCGFKAFKRNASEEIFKRMKVFKDTQVIKGAAVTAGFDLEILYIARKLGFKVAEVPVDWRHMGTVRVSAIKDSLMGMKGLLQVRINALMGKYNI